MKFGIIGCGGIARWHAGALREIAGAALAAVCDMDTARAQAMGLEYGVPWFTVYDEMLRAVDAVCICTPSGLHARQAEQALLAGKHVVAEKPLAITPQSLARVLAAQKQSGMRLCVVAQLRFSPDVLQARQFIGDGALGKILMADLSMKYWRSPAYYQNSGWRGTWAMDGGGALMNQGIHGLDLLRFLCGDVADVRAYKNALLHGIETEDALAACFTFANGGMGVLTAATCAWPGHRRRLEIQGSAGCLTLEEDRLVYACTRDGLHIEQSVDEPHGNSDPLAISGEPHRRQLAAFVEAVRSGAPFSPDGAEAAKTLELIFKIYEAAGRRIHGDSAG